MHLTLRYELRPVGYDSSADFYVYASHYKSSDDSTNAARRNVEAQEVRSNADALGPAHVIYAGDFNVYRSSEAMYQTLTAPGEGQAFDPLGRPGAWHDNAAFLSIHTHGMIKVHSDSQAAANKDFTQSVAFDVLDHARPLFGGNGDTPTLRLEFDGTMPGSSSGAETFSIANWISGLGFTAPLDFDSVAGSGDTAAFSLSLSPFGNLAPGAALDFSAAFTPAAQGSFNARYDLFFSDENLPGGINLRSLQLELAGSATPEPGSMALLLVAMLGIGLRRPTRHCQ